ncbi:POP4-like ribonuclease P protein subunit [Cryptosporidium canis]|uniref:Ribonuclease P protein subunit p29 n=1 Tax=Cryptosporidium canis TaxID=195482 RepID=A0ABQ8P797_9CRYT|nr:POP4-like ribonuclease P protein subunit [Cryptosporidium canis]KAJ1610850.1 POP4-like ribonuclease P protein subunit [Cryptosporidium canis]
MDRPDLDSERGHPIYSVFTDQEKVPYSIKIGHGSNSISGSLEDVGLEYKVMRDVEGYLEYSGGMDDLKHSGHASLNPKLTGITTSIIRMDKVKEDKSLQTEKGQKKLSHKVFKNEGFFDVAKEIKVRNLGYSHFIPLHQLWKQYMRGLTESSSAQSGSSMGQGAKGGIRLSQLSQSLSQADLHGSFMTVIFSKNKSCVNVQGIVVKETKETFVIISPDNKVRTVLKSQSIFGIVIPNNYQVTLYGSQLCYHPCERIKHKFRHRDSLNIIP